MEKEKIEIGINLRVTENADKGMRMYMEDVSLYYFEKCPDKPDSDRIKFAYFAVFDGHGGSDAAVFAKNHLLDEIKKIDGFWTNDDSAILDAIKQGFRNTHKLMWNERKNWPKTASGFDSTAGTTASIVIIRNRKLFLGHVGDSAVVLGYRDPLEPYRDVWRSHLLTVEHKPSNLMERQRIQKAGGHLKRKAGVDRVVWWRPTHPPPPSEESQPSCNSSSQPGTEEGKFECIPFLAVARSLGDLWSFDSYTNEYHVSPEPDVHCLPLDPEVHKCIILGSDGLWNMLTPDAAVEFVRICERYTELKVFTDPDVSHNFFYNPSGSLVKLCMSKWQARKLRADNITAMVVMLDPPGKPMSMIRSDHRRKIFDCMGISTMQESEKPQSLTQFLMPCEKWQNANRPQPLANNAPTAATKPGGSKADTERELFSPTLKPPVPSIFAADPQEINQGTMKSARKAATRQQLTAVRRVTRSVDHEQTTKSEDENKNVSRTRAKQDISDQHSKSMVEDIFRLRSTSKPSETSSVSPSSRKRSRKSLNTTAPEISTNNGARQLRSRKSMH